MYSCLLKSHYRNNFLFFLKKKGIDVSVHFDPPLHKQKYLIRYRKKLKNTDILAKEIVTLPIYPSLKKNDILIIFKTINEWYKKNVKK